MTDTTITTTEVDTTSKHMSKIFKHFHNVTDELRGPLAHLVKNIVKNVAKYGPDAFDKLTDIISDQLKVVAPSYADAIDVIEESIDGVAMKTIVDVSSEVVDYLDQFDTTTEQVASISVDHQ